MGSRLRPWLAAVLAGSAAGCIVQDRSYVQDRPSESAGSWRIEHRIDRITGKPAPSATVITTSTSNKTADIRDAVLQVTCFEARPVVRFSFDIRVGADRNSTFAYRVDDRPGDEVEATFLQDHRTVVIDDPATVAKFIEDVSRGSLLIVRTASLFAGRTVAEFRVVGASTAVAPVLAACPLVMPTSAPASPRRRAAADDRRSGLA
ncbi:hypothetical protein [Rhodoplanes sp. SY1]|uniref:hypothetical protein n=1 Tax=Rhodoplanes sp. SY1 TaxID=3166646 RepID=UPI0038B60B58